jgi:hypothetical protein
MRGTSARVLRQLCVVVSIGAVLVGAAATSAFAAPAHRPHVALTADQIASKANADLQSASSYRIYSSVSADGISISVSATATVQGCELTLNLGGGITENILSIGTSEWIQPSNEFWETLGYTGTDLGYLEGKWVTAAAFLQLFGVTNPPTSSGPGCSTRAPTGIPLRGWTLRRVVKISGGWAWRIINAEQGMSAYVSDTRKPEFLSLTTMGITEYFSGYNASVTLAPPPAGDVLTTLPPLPGGSIIVSTNLPVPAGLAGRAGLVTRVNLLARADLKAPAGIPVRGEAR